MLLKLPNDRMGPCEGIAYAVLFLETQWDAAAGAAIAYRVEILRAFNERVHDPTSVALL